MAQVRLNWLLAPNTQPDQQGAARMHVDHIRMAPLGKPVRRTTEPAPLRVPEEWPEPVKEPDRTPQRVPVPSH